MEEHIGKQMIDITAPDKSVEVSIRKDGTVIWVNVDGVCKLRICQIPHLVIDDRRKGKLEGEVD
jgi:hypothetical protein